MAHPLYYTARRFVGRRVTLYHVNGMAYCGTLMHVEPHGVYLMRQGPGVGMVSAEMDRDADASIDTTLVYYPGGYFAFGALTGLTLGALAGGWLW